MKTPLVYVVALVLTTAVLAPANYVSAKMSNGRAPHLDGNVQFPDNKRSRLVRHTFRLHVPQNSKSLSQLIIKVPENVTVSHNIKNIDVVNENKQKIKTNISVKDETILLTFPETIAPNTKFNIYLNKVKRSIHRNAPIYSLSAKNVGINAEIPIGVARFRTY
ncbi:MAG: DUF2808 domain-containing protein [Calothrix sp. MO_167.B12]|nr:DUF2808 domain-containing protein [Calothrix sp. MO_167.B12]